MQEHLIPQDISNYKFHLIGELDLMQFCEVLFGIIGGVLIYRFNWPVVVKWPLILLVVSLGLIAAFFPIADRPLSHWTKVYFGLLFQPTKFYWRKQLEVPSYFDFVLADHHRAFLEEVTTFNATPVKTHRAQAYFETLSRAKNTQVDELEIFNPHQLSRVSQTMAAQTAQAPELTAAEQDLTKVVFHPNLKSEAAERSREIGAPNQQALDQFLANALPVAAEEVGGEVNERKGRFSWPTA